MHLDAHEVSGEQFWSAQYDLYFCSLHYYIKIDIVSKHFIKKKKPTTVMGTFSFLCVTSELLIFLVNYFKGYLLLGDSWKLRTGH